MTVSAAVTAEASVRVTVWPERATVLTLRVVVPTVTVKVLVAGTVVSCSAWLRVMVSVVPFTVALWNCGPWSVLLVTAWSLKEATLEVAEACSALLVGWV